MEDIFLDDPRQVSAKEVSAKKKIEQKNKKRNFGQYFVDLIVKSLICATIISINFTLFTEAGSYNLFDSSQHLNQEAIIIYSSIFALSFLVIFLLSFSLFLQNLFTAIIGGMFILATMSQFALFDYHSILSNYFSAVSIFYSYSHLIIAGITGLIFLFFLTYGKRSNQAYFLGTILFIFAYILSNAYFNPNSHNFKTIQANGNDFTHPNGKNIVFIAFPKLTSYNNLHKLSQVPGATNEIKTASSALLGFYTKNNFTHYSAAYIENPQNPFLNLLKILNPNSPLSTEKLQLSNVILNGYWDTSNLAGEKIYLKNNKIYNELRNNSYNINVYQTRGIELCRINNAMQAAQCTIKSTPPINLDNKKFNLTQKTLLLTTQWLESSGIITGINPILKGLSFLGINKDITPLNFSPQKLYVYDSPKVLDLISRNIKNNEGNNAYFAVIDLPSDLYIYNNLCSLKPVSEWVSLQDTDVSLSTKRKAYAEQISCLYGKLENFIQELQKSSKLSETKIIIIGLDNPTELFPASSGDFYQDFKNQKQISLAIFDPEINKASTNSKICPAADIIGNYILQKSNCTEFNGLKISDNLKSEISKRNAKEQALEQEVTNSVNRFKRWYQAWAGHNQVNNLMIEPTIPLEKTNKEENEVIIKEAPIAQTIEELPEEKKLKGLSEVAQQTTKEEPKEDIKQPQDISQTKETKNQSPETKEPEALKSEEKAEKPNPSKEMDAPKSPDVKIEVKVIENQKSHDVVPPFLLGEVKYRPTEDEKE